MTEALLRGEEAQATREAHDRLARSRRRQLGLALALLLVAVLVASGVAMWRGARHRQHLEEARANLIALRDRARVLDRQEDWLGAYQLYRQVHQRGAGYLSEVATADPDISELAAAARRRAEELRELARQAQVPAAALEELVRRDRLAVFLGLDQQVPGTPWTAAGLGLTPESTPEEVLRLWAEPATRVAVGEDLERWDYRAAHGFAIVVRRGEGTGAGVLEQVILYPGFAGQVNGLPLAGCTLAGWSRQFPGAAPGSTSRLRRHADPFSGEVEFDDAGELVEIRIDLQHRR
jgi:hypothetical protein